MKAAEIEISDSKDESTPDVKIVNTKLQFEHTSFSIRQNEPRSAKRIRPDPTRPGLLPRSRKVAIYHNVSFLSQDAKSEDGDI